VESDEQLSNVLGDEKASRETLSKLENLRELLHRNDVSDLEERQRRSLDSIYRRLSVNIRVSWWSRWRLIQIPLPAVAATALVFAALVGVFVWSILPRPVSTAPDLLAQGKDVDVTIRVDNTEMEKVLQWLEDREMLGEINIQLPEQEFSIVGEPVLLKPEDYPEGFSE
jgi:predicted RNA binding protein with dsRBD fold (UPF0201 family)